MSQKPEELYEATTNEQYLEQILGENGLTLGELELDKDVCVADGPYANRGVEARGIEVSYNRWFFADLVDEDQDVRFDLEDFLAAFNDPTKYYETISFSRGKLPNMQTAALSIGYEGSGVTFDLSDMDSEQSRDLADYLQEKLGIDEDLIGEGPYISDDMVAKAVSEKGLGNNKVIKMFVDYFLEN